MNNVESEKEKCLHPLMRCANLVSHSLSVRLSSFALNGAESIMEVAGIKHFTRLYYSVPMTYLHIFSPPLFCCCHPPSFLHLPVPNLCPFRIYFIAFVLSHLSYSLSPLFSLIVLVPCDLTLCHPPPFLPLLPPSRSSLSPASPLGLSSQICNGAHSVQIFPLHSNAPPHYCSLCWH